MPEDIKFTEQQQAAITSPDGEFVVKAGAGTGKTRVLVHKYLNIFRDKTDNGETPASACNSILTVTFTRRAAREMLERLSKAVPEEVIRNSHISTIDAFCSRFLKENAFSLGIDPDFRVLDEVEAKLLFRKIGAKVLDEEVSTPLDVELTAEEFLNDSYSLINTLRQRLVSPEYFIGRVKENAGIHKVIYNLYRNYEKHLEKENLMDFGKILFDSYTALTRNQKILERLQNQFTHVLVDEYQDTNPAQVELLRLIAMPQNNYFAVGDEKQSIYGFRGAVPAHIVDLFSKVKSGKKVVLDKNFRSPEPLTSLVNTVFKDKITGYNQIESSVKGKAEIEVYLGKDRQEEAEFVASRVREFIEKGYELHDIVILLRGVKNCQEFEDALRNKHIPTVTVGGMGFYQQQEIKYLQSMLLVIDNPHSDRELLKVLRSPGFGVKNSVLAELAEKRQKNESLFSLASASGHNEIKRTVEFIERFREKKNNLSLVELIYQAAEESGLLYWAVSKTGGLNSRHMSNINKFISLARKFESKNIFSSIADFAAYLRQLEDAEIVEPEAKPRAKGVLHLMSVHQSKGLEFPVVFVSNIAPGNFPATARMDRFHFNDKHGLIIRDNSKESRYSKLLREYLYSQHHQEERRLLYVAMTRSKKHLVLSGSLNYQGKPSKYMQYFLQETEDGFKPRLNIKDFVTHVKEYKKSAFEIPEKKAQISKEKMLELSKNLGMPEFKKNAEIKSEFSVTELEVYSRCPALYNYQYKLNLPVPPPEKKYSANLFGSAVHRMLEEYYRVGNIKSERDMKDKIASLVLCGGVSDKEYNEYYRESAERTVKSLMENKIMLSSPESVIFVEQPFNLKKENVLIKGTIDRVDKIKGNSVRLVDYKTSVNASPDPYIIQLGIYKIALEEIFGYEVNQVLLAFVRINSTADVKVPEDMEIKLKSLIEGIKSSNFHPVPGDHCLYCPYKNLCPV